MSADFFKTIENPSTSEFKDRGSKFLAFAYPILNAGEFKSILQSLKKEHPKANHLCFGYRIGVTGDVFRVSDAGEPSGSAGRPILGQIDSAQVTNVLIIVVRYFGGTLLGVPGLTNAYKTSAALALQAAIIVQKPVLIYYRLQFDCLLMYEVMQLIKQQGCVIQKQDLQLFCLMEIGIPRINIVSALIKLHAIRGVELKEIK